MVQLEPAGSATGFTIAPQQGAFAHLIFLRRVKMKKSQIDQSTLVLKFNQQAATFAKHHARALHLSLNNRRPHRYQACNGCDFTPVLVAERQMKGEVSERVDVQFTQLLCQFRADTFQIC